MPQKLVGTTSIDADPREVKPEPQWKALTFTPEKFYSPGRTLKAGCPPPGVGDLTREGFQLFPADNGVKKDF